MPSGDNPALSYLLSSYAVPSACEVALVQVEIDNLTSQISRLHAKLKKCEKSLWSYRAVVSPVRRVPEEIWAEIFAFVFPRKLFQEDDRWDLVDLQLVCKAWRDAARSKHQLWSGVHVDMEDFEEFPRVKIEEWLNRSGSVPRSLEVFLPEHEYCKKQDSPCRVHNPALAALLAKGKPLRNLSLVYSGTECFQTLVDSLLTTVDAPPTNRPWDSLRSLACTFLDRWTQSLDPSKSIFISLPPNVISFKLSLSDSWNGFPVEYDEYESATAPLNIPPRFLEQLSSFSLSSDWGGLGYLDCTLPYCTNVEELYLRCPAFGVTKEDLQQRERSGFLLPKVRSLKLTDAISKDSLDILPLLRTPQLESLDISGCGSTTSTNHPFPDLGPVIKFVEGSSLRCFHLRNTNLDVRQLAGTLRHLPFLTHLTLDDIITMYPTQPQPWCYSPLGSGQLCRGGPFGFLERDDPPSLPQLEVLELLSLDSTDDDDSLLKFLQSRRPSTRENEEPTFQAPPETFKKLTLTFSPTVDSHRADIFIEKLKKSGVSVYAPLK
jgi:hypothetical protein